jgi:tRNA(fMet)-specific endonuclease VapC
MDYFLDTNIIIHFLRKDSKGLEIEQAYNLLDASKRYFVSIVTVAELYSFVLQLNWGKQRLDFLEDVLNLMLITDINSPEIISKYAEIDSYSQNRLKDKPMLTSARKMGKNDIWIAASAAVLNVPLLTTDADFIHLHNIYLDLHKM